MSDNTVGSFAESDPVKLPDLSTVFAKRAERLRALAPGHELEGFLRMIAEVIAAQHEALADLPPGRLPASSSRAPLDPATLERDETWRAALARILERLDEATLPEAARLARAKLSAAPVAELEAMADRFLEGDVRAAEAAEMVFVAAALQVAWTRMAALLDVSGLDAAANSGKGGQCPACGSPPVAGMVLPGGTKFGHRHLHCSLCATAWRYVRTRCVHCGSTDKISFRQLAGTAYLKAECCEACGGYSKVFYVESVRALEPLADDLASLGLDVLVGEEGFSRVANPFVLGVMSGTDGNN
ncbi:MAG: formate dehydrogenase accessory protein FdhE [Reyranella sp.]|nr:formate dehydrogenase accessory protein FdhE [Reyranella sp.]MBL6654091.1 formate dehydrogenase accessory protein FdhE [Reyranella sp.]